jgi:hypothetical protein
MTQVELLQKRLNDSGRRLISVTRGEDPSATPDQIAEQILRVLDQLDSGDVEYADID